MTDRDLDSLMKQVLMDSIQLDLVLDEAKDAPAFEASPQHQSQIQAMLKDPQGWAKRKTRTVWKMLARRVAVFFLAVALGFGAIMAGSPTAQASFMNWLKEMYETQVVYRFMGEDIEGEMPYYEITALPEGFVEVDRLESPPLVSVVYENDAGDIIYFNYSFMQQGSTTAITTENTDVIPITVNDLHGELYLSKDFEQRDNTVFWIDEELNICFDISGFYSATDILHIAESVSLSKTTK